MRLGSGLACLAASVLLSGPAMAGETDVSIGQGAQTLYGSLLAPAAPSAVAVLILAGSGAVNRDGDAPRLGVAPHTLKLVADGLFAQGVTSLRVDKRGVGASAPAAPPLAQMSIEVYVTDAVAWVGFLGRQSGVRCVMLLGDSEGALVATLAAERVKTCGLVLLSAPGRSLDAVLDEQIRNSGAPEATVARAHEILAALKTGRTVADVPPELSALFRTAAQPYLISELEVDPAAELAKLRCPVLIIQGDNDVQLNAQDASRLAGADPAAQVDIVHGANHALKISPIDRATNIAVSMSPNVPLAADVVPTIARFIRAHAPS